MFTKKTEPKFGCFGNIFGTNKFRSSRWPKASKCQLHIQDLLCSIKVHRNRRECMVRQSRSDIAQLLTNCRFSVALPKAKQFCEDERRLSAYDQVEYFCTSILQNFSPFELQSDVHLLPEETKEAMAGLIFAASRIGELKDLQYLRSLFVQRFGLEFDKDSVDLRPGNLVGSEIIQILDTSMPQDAISPEDIVMGISLKYNNEDSALSNNIGIADSDTAEIEMQKTDVSKKVMKEDSKFLHPNFGESQGRDRSSYMR